MTDEETLLIGALLDGWEQALHNVDSLWQVVQLVPDWEAKLRDAINNRFRFQTTQERFLPMRRAIQAILEGAEISTALQQALAGIKKFPS